MQYRPNRRNKPTGNMKNTLGWTKVSTCKRILRLIPESEVDLRSSIVDLIAYSESLGNFYVKNIRRPIYRVLFNCSNQRVLLPRNKQSWGIKVLALLLNKTEETIKSQFTQDDFYLDQSHCTDRIITEYDRYGKIIISVDFDDTLYDFHGTGKSFDLLIDLLKFLRPYSYVIINSSREESDYEFMSEYLKSIGIEYDTINENVSVAPFKTKKVYANIYVDDRGGLPSTYKTLCDLRDYIKEQEGVI